MKVILVTDVELNALVDRLELKKHDGPSSYEASNLGMTPAMFEAAHRHFHYHVVRWIQEIGGEVRRS